MIVPGTAAIMVVVIVMAVSMLVETFVRIFVNVLVQMYQRKIIADRFRDRVTEGYIELSCMDLASSDGADTDLNLTGLQSEQTERFFDYPQRYTGVEQRSNGHITTDSGKAIEISNLHRLGSGVVEQESTKIEIWWGRFVGVAQQRSLESVALALSPQQTRPHNCIHCSQRCTRSLCNKSCSLISLLPQQLSVIKKIIDHLAQLPSSSGGL